MALWLAGMAMLEPPMLMLETAKAAVMTAIVTIRSRRGVSQLMLCACSHERTPVAPAAAVITQAPHMG